MARASEKTLAGTDLARFSGKVTFAAALDAASLFPAQRDGYPTRKADSSFLIPSSATRMIPSSIHQIWRSTAHTDGQIAGGGSLSYT
jgi:hypothetical protein